VSKSDPSSRVGGPFIRGVDLTVRSSVCFVFDEELPPQGTKDSLEILDRWVCNRGHYERAAGHQRRLIPSVPNLIYNAGRLRRDLERKVHGRNCALYGLYTDQSLQARERRLILVCQTMGAAILKEVGSRAHMVFARSRGNRP
jgi:hypothetical protein